MRKTLSGAKFRVLRRLLEQDVRSCQICLDDHHFDLAHIVPRRKKGPMEVENILLLCPNHHRSFDAGTLLWKEFEKIESKVRAAEDKYDYRLEAYVEFD